MKYVPGRKSDVLELPVAAEADEPWGCCGRPGAPATRFCVVRAVARQREVLLTEQGSWVQRMQKTLVQMNIQLTEVLSDIMGTTGQAIIRAIVAGERRSERFWPATRHGRIRRSADDIARALTGNWREEHLFVLKAGAIDVRRHRPSSWRMRCPAWQTLVDESGRPPRLTWVPGPRAGTRLRGNFDQRQRLAN